MASPRYTHDCEECVFLGTHSKYDLYYCGATPTVISRYGADGDYTSGLAFASSEPILAIATVKAIVAGFLTAEDVRSRIPA